MKHRMPGRMRSGSGVLWSFVLAVSCTTYSVIAAGYGIKVLSRCNVLPNRRFDCAPEQKLSKGQCEARGCCFSPGGDVDGIGQPSCFYPPTYPTYKMSNLTQTDTGYCATLTRSVPTFMPRDIMTLHLNVKFETRCRLRFTITDPANKRYEVPIPTPEVSKKANSTLYDVQFNEGPFGLIIKRKSNGRVLVDTTVAPLLFADQFLQISTSLPTQYLYGLGEHLTSLNLDLKWTRLTFWNRDLIPQKDANLYGTHPFYLSMESDGSAHGVFLLNSNAMDVLLQEAPALTWRTTGGILDFYVFFGPEPKEVIHQYQKVIGFPFMPPFWGLGFHLSRWGYTSSQMTREAVKNMTEAGFPLDVVWNDIDYLKDYKDFTYDPEKFGDLPEMVKEFHQKKLKYVLIVEPAISSSDAPGMYPPFDEGLKRGVFITNETGQPLEGKVWPGSNVYPDFTNQEAIEWWYDMLNNFHKKVHFDGLWLDMNEPNNLVDGSLYGCPSNDLENPPYVPAVVSGTLQAKTICLSSKQNTTFHYDLHNLYGLTESIASYHALKRIREKRPFIISRSTYASHGHYAGHWTGDVNSTWDQLYYTISAIILFNIYGNPMVGADICGFVGDVTEELCIRWTQVGAFYPFMRNHNTIESQSQEPYVFSEQAQNAMKSALFIRYSLLVYLYTQFFKAHSMGETVVRGLFMEFPLDQNTWTNDRQFLWGNALLVSPVLEKGKTEVNGYFPAGTWYSPRSGKAINSDGQWILLPAPLDVINIHYRGGCILPTQDFPTENAITAASVQKHIRAFTETIFWVLGKTPGMSAEETRNSDLILVVAPDENGFAQGELYWDDGDGLMTVESGDYTRAIFMTMHGELVSEVVQVNELADMVKLGTVTVYGQADPPSKVLVNRKLHERFSYDQDTKLLTIKELSLPISRSFTIRWQ